ncbi:MAG: glycosyltransferase family 2 protein, partial [Microthrixaceae bacterium]
MGRLSKGVFIEDVAGLTRLRGTIHVPRIEDAVISPESNEPNSDPDSVVEISAADSVDRIPELQESAEREGSESVADSESESESEPELEAATDSEDADLDQKWGFVQPEPLVGVGAPPVVAVVITANPGESFEETLDSLAAQEYENLSVLVIDNCSESDPTPRVAEILPTAFVKRIEQDRGFSAAANQVLTSVEGAAFYLLLHDDVKLPDGAITALVTEAFRSNAGIVGPKLVDWNSPQLLRSVGYAVDPFGFASSVAEPGELDQSQHDIAREVFAVSDACMLIRADLFDTLGGFNEQIPFFGEDIDLCWRAHIAAATVHLCPSVSVFHQEGFAQRSKAEERSERLALRHEARMMLSNYELLRLLWVIPVAIIYSLTDLVVSLFLGRFKHAGDVTASVAWNFTNIFSLFSARSRVKKTRRTHDSSYLPLMRQGSSRLRGILRGQDAGKTRVQSATHASREYLRDLTSGPNRIAVAVFILTLALMALGARGLIVGPLPVFREFVDAGDSSTRLLSQWFTGWREVGLGEPAIAPGVVPGLGVLGTLLFGAIGLARRLLILMPLLVGAIGAWKLLVATQSTRARVAALTAYGLNPVVLNAIAEGRLQALWVYGTAPWLLRRLASQSAIAPFSQAEGQLPPRLRQVAGTALIFVLLGSVTPLGAAVLVLTMLLLAAASSVTQDAKKARHMAASTLAGALLAVPVLLPWLLLALLRGYSASLTGLWETQAASPSAVHIMTGSLGVISVGVFGWGLIIAAMYCLLSGNSWRLRWGINAWLLTLVSWLVTVLLAQSSLLGGAGAELFLMPAVLGLSLSVAMGVLAFERDVVGSDFGLSQVLSGVALAALVLGLVPIGVASANGRWYQPEGDFRNLLNVVDGGTDFRSLWIGDPDVLPLSPWMLQGEDGLAMGVSSGLDPLVTQRFRLDGGAGVASLTQAVQAALNGETSRLGRLLAPMGIRYILVINRPVPEPFAEAEVPMPTPALAALREQLDLQEVEINPGVVLFETATTWPLRSNVTDLDLPEDGAQTLREQLGESWSEPPAVLGTNPGTKFSASLPADQQIAQSVTADPAWQMKLPAGESKRTDLFGWSQQFSTGTGGDVTLLWVTPLKLRALQLLQVLVLGGLLLLALRNPKMFSRRTTRSRKEVTAELLVVGPEGLLLDETTARSAGGAI